MPQTRTRNSRKSILTCSTLGTAAQVMLTSMALSSLYTSPVLAAESTGVTATQKNYASTQQYVIEGGPLSDVLAQFAATAGVQLVFDPSMLSKLRSKGLNGRYTLKQGFEELLRGSGYESEEKGVGTYLLRENKQPEEVSSESGTPTLPEVRVQADKERASTPVKGYLAKRSSTATKTDTSLMEVPASIQVVTQDVLEDRQVIRLQQSLETVSGIIPSYNGGNTIQQYYARGFLSSVVLRDGYRGRSLGNFLQGTAHLERIEVLKGPASVLYGRGEPGGVINQVTKQPLATPFTAIKQQFGSYDLSRTTIDSTGSLNEDNSVLYRVNAAYENLDSFRDNIDSEGTYLAPVLLWKLSDQTQIKFDLQYEKTSQELDRGIVAVGTRPASIPISRNLAEPFAGQKLESLQGGLKLTHEFTPNLTLRYQFVAEQTNRHAIQVTPSGTFNADGRTMNRFFFEQKENFNSTFNMLELEAKFNTGSLAHKTLIGTDYYEATSKAPFVFRSFTPVDVYQPVYGASKPNLPLAHSAFSNDWYGVYMQDQIQVSPRVHLLLGGRYDQAKTVNESATSKSNTDDERFTPRTGIVFSMSPEVSVYGSYTESFGAANSGLSFSGQAFKPQTAKQYETGLKSELLDGRLSANIAAYHLTKQNILTADIANPGFSSQAGEARSRGVDVDVSGELTPQVNLIASYTYTDAKFTQNNDGNQGNQLSGVPKQAASLWGKYRLLGQLNGMTLGGGVVAQGERQGDDANTFRLPGFTRFDAFMAYRWKAGNHQLTTQVNVENLFDKEYFNASSSRAEIHPGYPRRVIASVGIEF